MLVVSFYFELSLANALKRVEEVSQSLDFGTFEICSVISREHLCESPQGRSPFPCRVTRVQQHRVASRLAWAGFATNPDPPHAAQNCVFTGIST